MAVIERTYTIPLRKEWQKSPKYRRAKKAVTAVKAFLKRHMKAELKDIKLGKHLNEELWKHGIKNPPPRIRINVQKDDKGIVRAELIGKPIVIEKKEEVKTGLAGKIKEKITGKEEKGTKKIKEEVKIGEDKETKEEKTPEAGKTEPSEEKVEKKPAKKEPKPAEKPKPVEKK